MINKDQFLKKFKNEFIDAENIEFTFETKFRDLDSWDSLTGMALLVMVEDQYKVKLTAEDFKKLNSVGEVYIYILENKK